MSCLLHDNVVTIKIRVNTYSADLYTLVMFLRIQHYPPKIDIYIYILKGNYTDGCRLWSFFALP